MAEDERVDNDCEDDEEEEILELTAQDQYDLYLDLQEVPRNNRGAIDQDFDIYPTGTDVDSIEHDLEKRGPISLQELRGDRKKLVLYDVWIDDRPETLEAFSKLLHDEERNNEYSDMDGLDFPVRVGNIPKDFPKGKDGRWFPSSREELMVLVRDESVKLSDIDVSHITSMKNVFWCCGRKDYSGIETWNVSHVTDMSTMFRLSSCNANLSTWDTSSVKNMHGMFSGTPFNQDISSWDTSKVEDMSGMFSGTPFNQDISSWDTSNVKDMSSMFSSNHIFNQPIGLWDVSHVTDMHDMFRTATGFNRNISAWDVSKVKNMSDMFYGAHSFNQPLNSWHIDTNKVNCKWMFSSASAFSQPLPSWNLPADKSKMFDEHYLADMMVRTRNKEETKAPLEIQMEAVDTLKQTLAGFADKLNPTQLKQVCAAFAKQAPKQLKSMQAEKAQER